MLYLDELKNYSNKGYHVAHMADMKACVIHDYDTSDNLKQGVFSKCYRNPEQICHETSAGVP